MMNTDTTHQSELRHVGYMIAMAYWMGRNDCGDRDLIFSPTQFADWFAQKYVEAGRYISPSIGYASFVVMQTMGEDIDPRTDLRCHNGSAP